VSAELAEHLGYLTDRAKVVAYGTAIRLAVTPRSVVLDVGTGSGLLGLLAAQAGARRVYSVDSGPILDVARAGAVASGFADRIVHLREFSTHLALPEPATVVVSDQIGGVVFDAGTLRYGADAAKRLCAPGAAFIPGRYAVRLTPVDDQALAPIVSGWGEPGHEGAAGLDFSAFADAAANSQHRVNVSIDAPLGPDEVFAELDAAEDGPFGGEVELAIERPGRLAGFLGTFVAELCPGVTLSNAPWRPDAFKRWQNFYPLRHALDVEPGDVARVRFRVAPTIGQVQWSGTVTKVDGSEIARFRHDTFQGAIVDLQGLQRMSESWTPVPGDQAEITAAAIELIDGSRSVAVVADELLLRFPAYFRSRNEALDTARSVARRIVDR
jgi:hypothetical protein